MAQPQVPLAAFTTLRAGGPAEWFAVAESVDALAESATEAQTRAIPTTYLGWGSNILPADAGVSGLCILNLARKIQISGSQVQADAGCGFQDLFLKAAQAGLGGLEFAVGIPGTLGGALVSNAGAYRSNISALLTEVEWVREGKREWVPPEALGFSYRDSILRSSRPPAIALLQVRLALVPRPLKSIYDEAREFQRQRIGKQPPQASAGSFFKNVESVSFAQTLDDLPPKLREAGVVPAGFLIERAGLAGARHGGAMIARRHANFMLNVGGATATEIRELASRVKQTVQARFGVELEEEVLYLGDWPD